MSAACGRMPAPSSTMEIEHDGERDLATDGPERQRAQLSRHKLKKHEFFSRGLGLPAHLSAEADDVLPELLGLALVVPPAGLHVHALPPLQRLDYLAEREVLLGRVARRTVLGLGVVEQRARRAAPLSHLLVEA